LSLHHLQHPVLEDLRQERKARAARRVALAARAKVLVPGQGKVQAQARPANHLLLPLLLLPSPVCILLRLLVARPHRRHLHQQQVREHILLHLPLRLPWAKLLHRPLVAPIRPLLHHHPPQARLLHHLLQQAVP
jgi:hypothetical protein